MVIIQELFVKIGECAYSALKLDGGLGKECRQFVRLHASEFRM
jgi:hypothetical protein